MRAKWLDREKEIRRLVLVEKMNDHDLAERYGVSSMTIRGVRTAFGLPMNPKDRDHYFAPPEPLMTFTIYEENGQMIKRYPPGYALGITTTFYTARPKR